MNIRTLASNSEKKNRTDAQKLLIDSPIPDEEKLSQVGLFMKRQELSKILFFNELYQQILNVHGIIIEFGTRWGQNLTTLSNLRGIYEPYNYNRKIVGFDTFNGFFDIDKKDGNDSTVKNGSFNVSEDYHVFLNKVLSYHETESPLSHIKKFEICKGDASIELERYLDRNPQTIIALVYFDFDIYNPTKKCLQLIKKHLIKGSVLGFDELNDPGFPGESLALDEVFGFNNIRLKRNKFSALQSYFTFD